MGVEMLGILRIVSGVMPECCPPPNLPSQSRSSPRRSPSPSGDPNPLPSASETLRQEKSERAGANGKVFVTEAKGTDRRPSQRGFEEGAAD
jgi:hypothetical protein